MTGSSYIKRRAFIRYAKMCVALYDSRLQFDAVGLVVMYCADQPSTMSSGMAYSPDSSSGCESHTCGLVSPGS